MTINLVDMEFESQRRYRRQSGHGHQKVMFRKGLTTSSADWTVGLTHLRPQVSLLKPAEWSETNISHVSHIASSV
jgi:hypothetical protein